MKDKSEPSDFLVKYKNETYNLKRFLHKHPGGRNTLAPLKNCDLTKILSQAPPHSDAAFYLMKEYRIEPGQNNNNDNSKDLSVGTGSNGGQEIINKPNMNGGTTSIGNGYTIVDKGFKPAQDHVDKDYSYRDNATGGGTNPGDDRLEVKSEFLLLEIILGLINRWELFLGLYIRRVTRSPL